MSEVAGSLCLLTGPYLSSKFLIIFVAYCPGFTSKPSLQEGKLVVVVLHHGYLYFKILLQLSHEGLDWLLSSSEHHIIDVH